MFLPRAKYKRGDAGVYSCETLLEKYVVGEIKQGGDFVSQVAGKGVF